MEATAEVSVERLHFVYVSLSIFLKEKTYCSYLLKIFLNSCAWEI